MNGQPEPIISVSGLRGIIGETLTPPLAARYVAAFAEQLPPGAVVVSRDGRSTGPMLSEIVKATLIATGRDVLDAGVAATPTLGILVREHQAAGGVQISASHNPPAYNGLKLFGSAGRVIPAAAGDEVIAAFRQGQVSWALHEQIGTTRQIPDTTTRHWELIRATVDVEAIRRRRFRVLLDANRGSGSIMGRRLLKELGCELTILGEAPDGHFEHPPEPTEENLAPVLSQVTSKQADIGFCQDPDADRLAVIDAGGRYLGEEKTLALCVAHLLSTSKGPIVTNCSTSRMAQDLAEQHGVPFFHAAVGEANVVDVMLAENALLGGEGNGGVIDPRVGLVRDSFAGMALILDAMAKRGATVAQLADALPRYAIAKTKIPLQRDHLQRALAALEQHFAAATASHLDGLRLTWPESWLLVRASNTEPIVRAIAEAKTAQAAQALCRQAAEIVEGAAGG